MKPLKIVLDCCLFRIYLSEKFIQTGMTNDSLLQEIEKALPSVPPPEPKQQLRRTSSAIF